MEKSRSLFEDAIDIPVWLDADQSTPFAERVSRDRTLARSLAESGVGTDPEHQVRRWWSRIAPATPGPGAELVRMRRWVLVSLLILGLLGGSSVSATVLRYDGSEPVNVVVVLAVLVGVQWLLLLLALVAVLPGVNRSSTLAAIVAPLNPAALVAGIWRRLSGGIGRPGWPVEFSWRAGRSTGSRLARWQIVFWSQCGAMAFNVAAVVTAVLLLGFTDLAFAWSTTFDIQSETVFRLTTVLSSPWQALFPEAVPSAELVESSRWFRLDTGGTAAVSPDTAGAAQVLTGWWPFLLLTLLVYGLLPRVLLGLFAAWRLRVATRAWLLEDDGVAALLDRMRNERVDAPAAAPDRRELAPVRTPPPRKGPVRGGVMALVWSESLANEAVAERARDCLGLVVSQAPVAAGGGMSLEADREAIDTLVAQQPEQIVVFVRAWEPPLLEMLDCLRYMCSRMPAAHILIHPVPESGEMADAEEVATWQRSMQTLNDNQVHVNAGGPPPGKERGA